MRVKPAATVHGTGSGEAQHGYVGSSGLCGRCGHGITHWTHSKEAQAVPTPPASPTVTLDRETFNKIAALAMTVHHKSECKALPVNRGGSAYDNAWDDYCDCGLNDVLARLRAAERQQ